MPSAVHVFLRADALLEHRLDAVGAAQHAGRRAAELDEVLPDRRQVVHRVEGRDLQHADVGHVEDLGDLLDGGLRHPAVVLLLGAAQQRHDGRGLPACRVFPDLLIHPGPVLRREVEAVGLDLGEAPNGHDVSSVFRRSAGVRCGT